MTKLVQEFDDILLSLCEYEWFDLPTPASSITNIELLYIYWAIKTIRPKVIFESGVGNGRSTVILAECMKDIGKVISARFEYPDDNWDLKDFEKDYSNLEIRIGRGEDVLKQISYAEIAVIDGPKPNGEKFKRPGWNALITEAKTKIGLLFQHDISRKSNHTLFTQVGARYGFTVGTIPQTFLGQIQETQNLGYYVINHTYPAPGT